MLTSSEPIAADEFDGLLESPPLSITFRVECPNTSCLRTIASPKNRERHGLFLWEIEGFPKDAIMFNMVHTCDHCKTRFRLKRGSTLG